MVVLMLGIVLLLVVGFTVPVTNDVGTKNVQDTTMSFHLGTIADKFRWGFPVPDKVFKCCNKFTISLHTVYVADSGVEATIKVGLCSTIVDSRCVRVDSVSCNGFLATCDVKCRELCLKMPSEIGTDGGTYILGSSLKRTLDNVSGLPGKVWDVRCIINT